MTNDGGVVYLGVGQEEIIKEIATEAGVSLRKAKNIVSRWLDHSDALYEASYRVGTREYKVAGGNIFISHSISGIVSEPQPSYGSPSSGSNVISMSDFVASTDEQNEKYKLMAKVLGLKTKEGSLNNDFDLIALVKRSLRMSSLQSIAKILGLNLPGIASLLGVSERTLQRKSPSDTLSRDLSQQLVSLAEVIARGFIVFEDEENFLKWLGTERPSLGGKVPKDLLETSYGRKLVLQQLGRIEHGIFS